MSEHKPSMRDIARAVGTSAVTVSKALAGKSGMSDHLRQKILQAAEDMGYVYGGEGIPGKPHLDIGILVPERYFAADSFYSEMYRQLVMQLTEKGHFGLLEILSPEGEEGLTLPNLVHSGRADGMIILGEPTKDYYRMLTRSGVPTVFLDFYDERGNADAVVGDNTYGTYRLTNHLIHEGHTRIGFVGNRLATASIMDRYLGYYRAMLTNELEIREDWILPDRGITGGLRMPELPEEMPTAFVCNCDLTARMMVEKLRGAGYRVPEDVSVTGFDDYPPGNETDIGLSTFRIDMEGMVRLAVKTVTERCAGSDKPFGRMVVGGQPVYRESEMSI